MKNSKLQNGTKILVINIAHFVKLSDFARALTNSSNCTTKPIDYSTLTKTQGKKILNTELFFHGIEGRYAGIDDLGDTQEEWNAEFEIAKEWVIKNYPYFNPS